MANAIVSRTLQRAGAFKDSYGYLTIAITRAPPWARGAGPVLSRVRPKYTPRTMKSQPLFSDFFEKIFIPHTIIRTRKNFFLGPFLGIRGKERLREIEGD